MLQFSVIIPTYNRAEFLKRCLNSVLACSLENIEVLVSDNASPDTTQEVLRSFTDSRLRFWRNETNIGAERNILNLLRAAKAEWVFCLGDDDFLLPNSLERLADILKSDTEIGVVLSNHESYDPNGNFISRSCFHNRTTRFPAGMEALSHMVWAAHVFSKICLRRKWLDLDGIERNLESMYPQMYAVGSVVRDHPGLFVDECFVGMTANSQRFWEYPKDFMVAGRILLIKDMLAGPRWKTERETLIRQVIDSVSGSSYSMTMAWSSSARNWIATQIALVRIREVAFSPRYWQGLMRFIAVKVYEGLIRKVLVLIPVQRPVKRN